MELNNLLTAKNRDELREWLMNNHDKEKECWVAVKRGKPVDNGTFWYIDAVEEARIGKMTDAGREVLPDMSSNGFVIDKDI